MYMNLCACSNTRYLYSSVYPAWITRASGTSYSAEPRFAFFVVLWSYPYCKYLMSSCFYFVFMALVCPPPFLTSPLIFRHCHAESLLSEAGEALGRGG